MAHLSLSTDSISTLTSEVSDEEMFREHRSDSFGTSMSEEEHDQFQHDASTSVYESLREGVSADVVQLELVSLRMSANASDHQVRRAIATAFMRRVQALMESGKGAGEAVRDVFTNYKVVVERGLFDKNKDEKNDQVDLLLQIQQDLIHRAKGETILLFTAKQLYDLDVIEEEAFEAWWEDERSKRTEELRRVRSQTQQFIEWLATAEEEDSEEEEEDSEEEESE